jgi:hypothetical protein
MVVRHVDIRRQSCKFLVYGSDILLILSQVVFPQAFGLQALQIVQFLHVADYNTRKAVVGTRGIGRDSADLFAGLALRMKLTSSGGRFRPMLPILFHIWYVPKVRW